jgi:hypothetical protein
MKKSPILMVSARFLTLLARLDRQIRCLASVAKQQQRARMV